MANRWGSSGNSDRVYFGELQITADGNCSHEIKRCLFLERKVIINLDSMLKSRDFTLPTKVHLVKAMVCSVVIYGCESLDYKVWAPKNWCFWTAVLEKTLESPLDSKEMQPVHPKGYQPGCSLEGLILKLNSSTLVTWCEELTHLKRPWCWERLREGEGDDRG